MSPLMARKPARGLSASRRPAMSAAGRLARRAMTPGADHGQPRPGDDQPDHDQQEAGQKRLDLAAGGPGMPDGDEVRELGDAGQQRDQTPGAGGRGVTRRLTPSGEICTRRSATGARRRRPRAGRRSRRAGRRSALSDRSPGKKGSPVNGTVASDGRSTKNRPKPAATPSDGGDGRLRPPRSPRPAAGVAPTSRMAANRCSRRAADSRVAVPMKISTGNSSARRRRRGSGRCRSR